MSLNFLSQLSLQVQSYNSLKLCNSCHDIVLVVTVFYTAKILNK